MLRSVHRTAWRYLAPPPEALADYPDVWAHLFAALARLAGAAGEIWRKGQACDVRFDGDGVVQRHRLSLGAAAEIRPEVIWQRGNYSEYHGVVAACPEALTIYYGAGAAWCPPAGRDYDIILVDSPEQLQHVRSKHPRAMCRLLIKPAVETIFRPVARRKEFDLVAICSRPREFKGMGWLAERLPAGASVLRIGPADKWFRAAAADGRLDVTFAGELAPRDIPRQACRARAGAVVDDGKFDSAPRVLPEMLAMGLPVLVRDTVRVDHGRYVNAFTGLGVNGRNFGRQFEHMMAAWETYEPREYYRTHLAVEVAAAKLLKQIRCRMRDKTCT